MITSIRLTDSFDLLEVRQHRGDDDVHGVVIGYIRELSSGLYTVAAGGMPLAAYRNSQDAVRAIVAWRQRADF
jgi:hypothetical protein